MSTNLPIPSPDAAAAAMRAMPVQQRSSVRKEALDLSSGWIRTLDDIANDPEQKGATRVQAAKAGLAVAALLSSVNLPRDVVEEKFTLTVDLCRDFIPEDRWAEFARRLSPIWSDV